MNPNNASYLLNFTLPRGDVGATGPTGPTGPDGSIYARSAYLVTFNDGTFANGITIQSGDRLPIDREELDISDIITLDTADDTLQFNLPGYYKITFTVSAYVLHTTNSTFDPNTDFVSLGFKLVGTDNVYIGTSQWVTDETAIELVGQGIIAVVDIAETYELVNLAKENIYLSSPDQKNTISNSLFCNPLVTIVIEYLGRQGA